MKIQDAARFLALCSALLCAAIAPSHAAAPQRVLQAGHTHVPGGATDQGLKAFAGKLSELSGGRIEVRIHPGGELGDEYSMAASVVAGKLDICMVGGQMVESLYPPYAATNIPYIFRDYDHLKAFIRSRAARDLLLRASRGSGFSGLWLEASGPRCFFAKFPIRTPSDLAGLAIRVPESEMSVKTVQLLGAQPNPLSTTETYSALEHSVIDGAENNFLYYVQEHYYEVAPVFSEDMHSMAPNVVIISEAALDAMTPKEREWVDEAAVAGREAQIEAYEKDYAKALSYAGALGIEIVKVDTAPFVERTRAILEEESKKPAMARLIKAIGDLR
ncbi:MAG: TRAP transporter substrate-binding protein DctP [Succinivibrio sp.]